METSMKSYVGGKLGNQMLGGQCEEAVPAPHIANNLSRLRNLYNLLTEVRDRLSGASDRLHGMRPKPVETGKLTNAAKPSGYVGEFAELLEDCENTLSAISSELNELERAV